MKKFLLFMLVLTAVFVMKGEMVPKSQVQIREIVDRPKSERVLKEPEDSDYVTLKFEVKDEKPEGFSYEPIEVIVYQPDGEFDCTYWDSILFPTPEMQELGIEWECQLPKGRYDLILRSQIRPDDISPDNDIIHLVNSCVIIDDMDIDNDMTYTFTQSDAKNKLSTRLFYPDGKEIPENINFDVKGMEGMSCYRSLQRKDGGYLLDCMMLNLSNDEIYVNDLSEKWTYAFSLVCINPKASYVCLISEDGPFESSHCFENSPSQYGEPFTIEFSKDMAGQKLDTCVGGISTMLLYNGKSGNYEPICSYSYQMNAMRDGIPVYLCIPESNQDLYEGWKLLISGIGGYSYIDYEWPDQNGEVMTDRYFITINTPYMYADKDGITSVVDKSLISDFGAPVNSPMDYCYTEGMRFYAGVPIVGFEYGAFYDEWQDKNIIYFESKAKYPCLGECVLPKRMTVSFNGEIIADNVEAFDFIEWTSRDEAIAGCYNVTIEMPYREEYVARTELAIDNLEHSYPSVQVNRWQMRSSDGRLTGILSGGSYLMIDLSGEGDLQISVAEHGTDNWIDLLAEYIDNGCYRVDFDNVVLNQGKWYDLKFISGKSAENTVSQMVEHAFKCDSGVGVEQIIDDSHAIKNDKDLLMGDWKVFDLSGIEVDSEKLRPGIYIVKCNTNTFKMVVK